MAPELLGISAAAFSPDGKTLVVWTLASKGSGVIRFYDPATGMQRRELNVRDVRLAAFSPDSTKLATVDFNGNAIKLSKVAE